MTTRTVLITGSNRGLGLEFVKQYQSEGWRVIACCRNPQKADALQGLKSQNNNLRLLQLDVADHAQVEALPRQLEDEKLDLLINNAGVYGHRHQRLDNLQVKSWLDVFKINSISPIIISRALLPCFRDDGDKIIANVSSKMGSVEENTSGMAYLYRSSKAALNAATMSLAQDLEELGFRVVALHPGWVRTDMGGPDALITPEESIAGMRKVIDELTFDKSGSFFDYSGKRVPW